MTQNGPDPQRTWMAQSGPKWPKIPASHHSPQNFKSTFFLGHPVYYIIPLMSLRLILLSSETVDIGQVLCGKVRKQMFACFVFGPCQTFPPCVIVDFEAE